MTRTSDQRRHTLILAAPNAPRRSWTNPTDTVNARTIHIQNLAVLRYTLRGLNAAEHDVERIVIDHAASPLEQLRILAELPDHFAGDVLFITEQEAFLSASTRGDGRKLWQLNADNLEFYLHEQRLITTGPRAVRPATVFTGIRIAQAVEA